MEKEQELRVKETEKALRDQERQALAEQKAIDDWNQILSAKKSAYIEAVRSGNVAKGRALEMQIHDMKAAGAQAIIDEINKLKIEYRKNLDIIASPTASVNDKYWAKKRNEDVEGELRSKNTKMTLKMNIGY